MIVVFSSFYVSDIWSEFTDGGVIAKLIRHHLLSDWNVRWRERPLGLVDSLHLRFLHTAESVRVSPPVIIILWLPFKKKNKNKKTQNAQTIPKKRHKTETQSEFTTKIFIKKKKKPREFLTWRRSTSDRVLAATDDTFCPDWPDAGRSRPPALIDSGTVVLLELNLALCLKQRHVTSAVPLSDWSTAAVSSNFFKKLNQKAFNTVDVRQKWREKSVRV